MANPSTDPSLKLPGRNQTIQQPNKVEVNKRAEVVRIIREEGFVLVPYEGNLPRALFSDWEEGVEEIVGDARAAIEQILATYQWAASNAMLDPVSSAINVVRRDWLDRGLPVDKRRQELVLGEELPGFNLAIAYVRIAIPWGEKALAVRQANPSTLGV